jgi:UDP-MurNAc hydroxylase
MPTPWVQHLGHAGFLVEHEGFKLVTDPWFNSAFLKAWFPWPDNRHLAATAYEADALYISHAHEDHFDRSFLELYDRKLPVVVAKFRSRYMERELRRLGFTNIVALSHGERHTFTPGFTVTMLTDRSHKEDSALLMDIGGYRFLDSNDCELASSDWPDQVDLLAAQFSGAFWYPHCYDYDSVTMKDKESQVRVSNLTRLLNRVNLTGAKSYLPSAGPAVFLDPRLLHFNDSLVYPSWPGVASIFKTAFPDVEIRPGLENRAGLSVGGYQRERVDEWQSWYAEPVTPATDDEILTHFRKLGLMNKGLLKDYERSIRLISENKHWDISLNLVAETLEEAPDPHYTMQVSPRVLRAVLDGRATWETALLSNRIELRRNPDEYDLTLMSLLTFGDRPAQTVAMKRLQQDEEDTTKDGYIFQRWCPHAGEDLSTAPICNGVIECPRHNWKWDLTTGECLKGQLPLRTRPVGDRRDPSGS